MLEPTAIVPPHTGHGTRAPAHLTRARLRLAWAMSAQVGKPADRLPLEARGRVAQALAALVQVKALVEERALERAMLHAILPSEDMWI